MGGFISALDPNAATLLSGAMSMIGGALGALGAYWVATYQTKKQFLKQDSDRVLELRIDKMNGALTNIYSYLSDVQFNNNLIGIIKGQVENPKFESITNSSDLTADKIKDSLNKIKKYDVYMSKLEEYKIFIPNVIDFLKIKETTSNAKTRTELVLNQLEGFVTSVPKGRLKNNPSLINESEKADQELIQLLQEIIKKLEKDIQAKLNIK